jgi:hypothetical protein
MLTLPRIKAGLAVKRLKSPTTSKDLMEKVNGRWFTQMLN